MKKRILSIIMAAAMVLSLLPMSALAVEDGVIMYINSNASYEDGTPPDRAEGARYKNLADAAKAVMTSKDIVVIEDAEWTFATDFTLAKPTAKFKLQVAESQTLTVDIQGCTVDLSNVALQNYGTLTVTDSTNGGSGTLTSTASPVIENYGSATVSGKVTVATTGSMAVKGTKSTSTFVLENGTLTGKSYGYFGTAAMCQLKQGVINGGVSPSSGTLTIGTQGSDNQSLVINGSLKMSDSVTVYCGDIKDLTGTIESDVVFNGILRTDVSSKLPAGKKCTASGPDTKGTYYTIEDMQEGDAAAQVGNNLYASLTTAAKAVKNNETLTLLKDHTGSSTITINAYGVTVDLNGHSITNTSSDKDAVGLKIHPNYGVKPTDGNMTTLIKNSSDTQAAIKASTPLSIGTGNSQNIISASMEGNIALNPAGGQSIELGNARLIYSEDAANTVGGYRATTADGTYIYGTFQAAIDADVNKTAVLLSDVSGSGAIKFSNGETGILDLGGHTYTYTGSGAVIEVNDSNTNLTIKNGTIVSDGEGAYVGLPYKSLIPKNVSLTLDDVDLTVNGEGYGAVSNGRCSGINLTLQNGTVLSAPQALAVYWPSGSGTVTIDNSQITAHTGVQICGGSLVVKGEDTIITATGTPVPKTGNDGGISDGAAISIVERDGYKDLGTVTIEAGTFKASTSSKAIKAYTFNNTDKTEGAWAEANKTISISGGTFSSDPSAYVTEEYIALIENGQYVVQEKSDDTEPATVVGGAPETTVSGVPNDQKEAVEEAVNGIQAGGLTTEANAEANTNTITVTEGTEKLKAESVTVSNDDTVTIVVQPYLQIEVTGYKTSEDTSAPNTMTLNITPMVRTVATTADLENDGEIYLKVEDGKEKNAVIMETGKEMSVTTPITLTIPLPNGFVTSEDDKVYVQHKGYEYNTAVTSDGEETPTYTATFTNPHGFSTFTISTESQTVAMLNGDSYTSLQDALADAGNGDTVTVLQDGLSASMSGSTRTITLANGVAGAEITVTINGVELSIAQSETETYTYTRPSSGGGSSTPTYTVSKPLDVTGGEISVSPSRAAKNATVTITVKPDEGYELDELIVRDSDGETVKLTQKSDTEYTFKMPASKVTVEASFVEIEPVPSELPFTDVAADAWYHDAVAYVYDNGMMNGVTENTFAPNATTTRGMIVTMLHRLEGEPGVNYLLPFGDVAEGLWYTEAVRWAASEGIVNGVSDTSYAPDNAITREQMAAILYRYAQYKGYDTSVGGMSLAEYTDADQISSYATTAMQWANENGLITGRTDTTLVPQGTATRAEVATILMRFCEDIAK